jgi:nitrogen fixation protein FixH
MTQTSRIVKPFTGRHMAIILVTFFAIVIAVNVMMARFAISTFGGVVVENSYVASQKFNGWLNEARAEKALGWKAKVARAANGEVVVTLANASGAPLNGAHLAGRAEHPLGRRPDTALMFHETAPGSFAARLEQGRWRVRLTVVATGHTWRTVGDVL